MTTFDQHMTEQDKADLRERGILIVEAERLRAQRYLLETLYDAIRDFLDDVPAGVPRVLVARLEDAAASLREQIARMVGAR